MAVVAPDVADTALSCWRTLRCGEGAAIIGHVDGSRGGRVVLTTSLGGERYLEELEDDPLPRIC